MVALEDTAEELIALFTAFGAVNQLNALGTLTSTGTNALPDPTVQAYSSATLSTSGQVPFTLPQPAQGKKLRLQLIQDSTGSRTASFATSGLAGGGALQWAGSAAPTLTTTGTHADILEWECFDGANWVGSVAKANVH